MTGKDVVKTVRVTPDMDDKIKLYSERAGVSEAEVVRRCVRNTLSDEVVLISLNRWEKNFVDELSDRLGVMPAEAIKMQLLTMKVLETYGVFKQLPAVDQMLEEIKKKKEVDEITNDVQ